MNIYPQFEIMNNMKVKPILSQPHTFLVKILSHMVNHLSGNLFVPTVIVNFIYHSYIKPWDAVNSGNG